MNECFNCGEQGHWKDACPTMARAGSHQEHMSRIEALVDRWVNHEITVEQKRTAISHENLQWYGPECPRRLIWP
jgi:hypothetical protein